MEARLRRFLFHPVIWGHLPVQRVRSAQRGRPLPRRFYHSIQAFLWCRRTTTSPINAYTYAQKSSLGCSAVSKPVENRVSCKQRIKLPNLKQIAQIIQVRAALGVQRQIYFAGVGNFDTHADQLALQSTLLAEISPALARWRNATVELNVANMRDHIYDVGFQPHFQ